MLQLILKFCEKTIRYKKIKDRMHEKYENNKKRKICFACTQID